MDTIETAAVAAATGGGIYIGKAALDCILGMIRDWFGSRRGQPRTVEGEVKLREPVGVSVGHKPEYVTRHEFEKHEKDNETNFETLYGRIARNDRETSETKGILTGIREDVSLIKNKLFRITK